METITISITNTMAIAWRLFSKHVGIEDHLPPSLEIIDGVQNMETDINYSGKAKNDIISLAKFQYEAIIFDDECEEYDIIITSHKIQFYRDNYFKFLCLKFNESINEKFLKMLITHTFIHEFYHYYKVLSLNSTAYNAQNVNRKNSAVEELTHHLEAMVNDIDYCTIDEEYTERCTILLMIKMFALTKDDSYYNYMLHSYKEIFQNNDNFKDIVVTCPIFSKDDDRDIYIYNLED